MNLLKNTPASARAPAQRQRKEQQRSIDTRTAMVKAALLEFAGKGFDGASTRDIASRAGVKQQLVIYHFGSKDGLWKAVALDLFAELEAVWARDIPEDSDMSAIDRVKTEFRNFLQFTIEYRQFHHFMLQENLPDSPRLEWLVKNVLSRISGRILPQIREAQNAGQMIEGDPALVYYSLVGIVAALSSLAGEMRILTGIEATDPDVVERYWAIVERALFR